MFNKGLKFASNFSKQNIFLSDTKQHYAEPSIWKKVFQVWT